MRTLALLKTEGLAGVRLRLKNRIRAAKFSSCKVLNLPIIKSAYGLKFASRFDDKTFEFYVLGNEYGRFFWDRISEIDYPFVFLDIGANQGLYAIGASKNKNNIATYAFEPVPDTFAYLIKNIRLNNVEDKCHPINKAIGSEQGSAIINFNAAHSGGATLARRNNAAAETQMTRMIEVINSTRLDRILESCNVRTIVKIDVEGFELVVIKEILKSRVSALVEEVFFEVDEAWVDACEIQQVMRAHGFTSFRKIGSGSHYDVLATRV